MYTVFVRLEVRRDKLNEFIAGIQKNARASLSDEPGCIRFDVHRDANNPHTFYFYEIYLDREAFEIHHRNAPHYAEWRKVVQTCVVPDSQANLYAKPMFPGDVPEYTRHDEQAVA